MNELSNKAIVISVSLLVTIAIASSILAIMGYFKDIYKTVEQTNISVTHGLKEYDKYDHTVLTGLEVENAWRQFRNDPYVRIYINDQEISKEVFSNEKNYSKYYDAQYIETERYVDIKFNTK